MMRSVPVPRPHGNSCIFLHRAQTQKSGFNSQLYLVYHSKRTTRIKLRDMSGEEPTR